ncbi:peptidoglycan-binding domain-containing protein [Kitasatospora purpeofusca]|uniref:peptidoglycan-binding domain-containing protein n=1 Tax=Kitasatospora purpeofusca TaxID=67352 RepID=UPI00369D90D8
MPDQRCPTCGSARSTGCGCLPPDHGLDDTAVLPHLEGPPLVRPYVPQAVGQVAEPVFPATLEAPPAPEPPTADPFGTTVLPAVAPAPATPPLGPDADAYATTVLPPVATAPQFPPSPAGAPPRAYGAPAEDELGVFPVAPDAAAPTGGRAARRAAEQENGGGPGRRKGLLIAAGAGLLALTVGLAYAVTPSADPDDRTAPPPSTTIAPAPVAPTTPAAPSPSSPPPTSDTPTPTPSRTSAKPSPTRSTASTPPPAAPSTTAAAAPPAPAPAPTSAPATQPPAPSGPAPSPSATPTPTPTASPSATPTPTPTPTPTNRVLQYGMQGTDVQAMQQKLAVVMCWMAPDIPVNGYFDGDTEYFVSYFQSMQGVRGDKKGVYGANTRAALEKRTGC